MIYRKSVLYDFSVVSKAKFYIFERDEKAAIPISIPGRIETPYKFKLVTGALPVQVNPSSLNANYGEGDRIRTTKTKRPLMVKNASGVPITSPPDQEGGGDSLSLSLRYDIYDEYMINSMNDTIPLTYMSLTNKLITSLPTLTYYANRPGYYALFLWGEFEYFGILSSMSCEYRAFSRFGTPLKADTSVTIRKQPLGYTEFDGTEISPLSTSALDLTSKAVIFAEQVGSLVSTTAEAAAEKASGLALGATLLKTGKANR